MYMYTVTLDFKVILIVVGIIFGIKPEDLVIIIIIIIFMDILIMPCHVQLDGH